jgi:hypothetical protein
MNSPLRTGIALGCFLASLHLIWSLLVLTGLAQPLINIILWLHMLSVPVQVQPFELGIAALLIGVTWCVGFGYGFLFSVIWRAGSQKPRPME